MSSREKNLLFLFLAAMVAVGGLFGFRWYQGKKLEIATEIESYRETINIAEMAQAQWDSVQDEVAWLQENQLEPQEGELVPSRLESFTTNEARRSGLTINKQTIIENDESGGFYHRARFKVTVTGTETALYSWLVRLHNPKQFQAVTELRLSPNREDDTKIDAVVQVERWFLPKDGSTAGAGEDPGNLPVGTAAEEGGGQ